MSSVPCPQCGAVNWSTDLKCRSCGLPVSARQEAARQDAASPVEKVINDQPRYQPGAYTPPLWTAAPPVPVNPYANQAVPSGFRCPYCQSQNFPRVLQKISSAGWVAFIVLLFFCIPLCWIGLLMKEDYRVCSSCGMTLG
jgi:predicted RNA-binding Zn-ribbon protein involved in translation (DUF1610 family)